MSSRFQRDSSIPLPERTLQLAWDLGSNPSGIAYFLESSEKKFCRRADLNRRKPLRHQTVQNSVACILPLHCEWGTYFSQAFDKGFLNLAELTTIGLLQVCVLPAKNP